MAWEYIAAGAAAGILGAMLAPDPEPYPEAPKADPYANLGQSINWAKLQQPPITNTVAPPAPMQIVPPNAMLQYRQLARAYMQTGMG